MKQWIIRRLPGWSRAAKRLLGVPVPQPETPPPPPLYLDPRTWRPTVTDAVRPRSVLFMLYHPSRGSGGLADILHLAVELERSHGIEAWFTCVSGQSPELVRENVRWTNSAVRADRVVGEPSFAPESVCATAWPSAYSAMLQPSRRKLYFVQDYEPLFHRAGVARHYAGKTYELGMRMFTLGPWVAHRMAEEHGAEARVMPYPISDTPEADPPLAARKTVAIFLQPHKAHRGVELLLKALPGIVAVASAHGCRVEVFGSADNEALQLAGVDAVHGLLPEAELKRLFRRSRVGVCTSFTNISLLTMRFLSFGCRTVDLAAPNVLECIPEVVQPWFVPCEPAPDDIVRAVEAAMAPPAKGADTAAALAGLERDHGWPACARAVADLFS